jgi:NADP-dependent 3-hydroxy acid dehydrogenase YdfG
MTNGPSRVVLITGASSGIGRATAELLAGRSFRVFGGVRTPATTLPVASVELVPLDVRDNTSVKACVEEVRSRAGRIDVLINNAGINLVGAVEETSIGQVQALFETNVFGVLRMIQAVLPGMRHQGGGKIVNISSILGFLPAPYMGVYASTKHAIEGQYARTSLDASAACAHRFMTTTDSGT